MLQGIREFFDGRGQRDELRVRLEEIDGRGGMSAAERGILLRELDKLRRDFDAESEALDGEVRERERATEEARRSVEEAERAEAAARIRAEDSRREYQSRRDPIRARLEKAKPEILRRIVEDIDAADAGVEARLPTREELTDPRRYDAAQAARARAHRELANLREDVLSRWWLRPESEDALRAEGARRIQAIAEGVRRG